MKQLFFEMYFLLRGAERVWPPSAARWSVAVPNGEGVATGSATKRTLIELNFIDIK